MATTFSELWDELKAGAEVEWQKLEAAVVSFEHNIVPIIEADIVAVLSQFKDLAIQTVLNLAKAEFADLTGQEKQSTVVTTIFQAAEAAGKQVAIEDARMFAQQTYDAVASALGQKQGN